MSVISLGLVALLLLLAGAGISPILIVAGLAAFAAIALFGVSSATSTAP